VYRCLSITDFGSFGVSATASSAIRSPHSLHSLSAADQYPQVTPIVTLCASSFVAGIRSLRFVFALRCFESQETKASTNPHFPPHVTVLKYAAPFRCVPSM
jgi:hypothetical protein